MRFLLLVLYTFCINFFVQGQWHGFDTLITYDTRETVNLVHTKDMTGDGVTDLTLFYSAAYPSFDILAGSNETKFSFYKNVPKEDNYFLSDIGNLNGDAYPDLVISSYWNNGFKIFFGKGSGTFAEGVYLPTGVHGRAVKCVDINRDGITDIVATTSGSGRTISLHVFIGKGDGSFEPKKTFDSVLDTSKEIIVMDKNGDGLLDVVVTSSFAWIVMFLQEANGDFTPAYFPTFQPARISFADLNKDGADDMVLLYSSFDNTPGSDSVVVRLNNGGDSFSGSTRVAAFEGRQIRPFQVVTTDLNKDGWKDLLLNHTDMEGYPSDTIFFLLGKSATEFSQPQYFVLPGKLAAMQVSDLDGNGYPDLIASCDNKKLYVGFNHLRSQDSGKPSFIVYPNPAPGQFTVEVPFSTPYFVRIVNAAGQELYKEKLTGSKANLSPRLPKGLYYISVLTKSQEMTKAVFIAP